MTNLTTVIRAKDKVKTLLENVAGVEGIGLDWTPQGDRCVRVNVSREFTDRAKIPPTIDGVTVKVAEVTPVELQ